MIMRGDIGKITDGKIKKNDNIKSTGTNTQYSQ